MIKAVIIDDEINGIKYLEHLIVKNCPNVEIIGFETDPETAILLVNKLKPDVVFLDIEMPTINGFELLEQIKHLSFHVIFTTAYNSYAIKAFKYNTIDYLLKPVIANELMASVEKLAHTIKQGKSNLSIEHLLKKIEDTTNKKKLVVNGINEIIYIEIENIIRLESDSNYTNVFLVGGKKITTSKTLKEYESVLDSSFYRIHKAFIVNLNHIEKYVKTDGGYIVMKDNAQIPVSRDKRQILFDILATR